MYIHTYIYIYIYKLLRISEFRVALFDEISQKSALLPLHVCVTVCGAVCVAGCVAVCVVVCVAMIVAVYVAVCVVVALLSLHVINFVAISL